jgi:hypothetical protein
MNVLSAISWWFVGLVFSYFSLFQDFQVGTHLGLIISTISHFIFGAWRDSHLGYQDW